MDPIDRVWRALEYARAHPWLIGLVLVIAGGIYYLQRRPSKLTREADSVAARMRNDRGDYYNHTRPLR